MSWLNRTEILTEVMLNSLPNLKDIDLAGSGFGQSIFISDLPSLSYLYLRDLKNPKEISIQKLPNLWEINFDDSHIGKCHIDIGDLPKLSVLSLKNASFTNSDLSWIRQLKLSNKNLKIDFDNVKLSGAYYYNDKGNKKPATIEWLRSLDNN